MTSYRFALTAAVFATLGLAGPVSAHRLWMLPSTTVVSGEESWVTFDAATSSEVFNSDHQPVRAEPVATAPDGAAAKVENFGVGKFRATFDLHLTKQGTWKVALANGGVMGSYKQGGEIKRLPRGTAADKIAGLIPADATEVKLAETSNRNEVFVTLGAPTVAVLKPTGSGLEFVPVTHPNDLVVSESAVFGFTVDGKPAAGLTVTVVRGGSRYRSAVGEITLTTDAKGQVTVKWPAPGMYWVNAVATGTSTAIPNAERRLGYTTTLEVLGN